MKPLPLCPVIETPFPHVLVDGWLEPELYAELARSFPECPPGTGPTGFTAFWGDDNYARLLETSPGWQALFDRVHSQVFIDYVLAQFAPAFRDEAVIDLSNARYVPYLEDRVDKERAQMRKTGLAPDELFVRMDILQGWGGYAREPHVDHRRRAATMLIYFCDADAIGMEGGDLVLHAADGAAVTTVRARENRMVLFACSNRSLHSVLPITRSKAPRNFVQILVSSSVDLWPPMPTPRRSLVSRIKTRLLQRA